jgi:hypothetical protein
MLRLAPLFMLLVLAGCTNPWREAFEAARPGAAQPRTGTRDVVVRHVPWERLAPALERERALIAADPRHPDDWPQELHRRIEAILLEALQAPPEQFRIVGRSHFRSTQTLDPGDGSLARAARAAGADLAVWSTRSLGMVERTATEPVHSYTSGTITRRGHDGKVRTETYSQTTTTHVPVRVRVEEREFVAFFLARSGT